MFQHEGEEKKNIEFLSRSLKKRGHLESLDNIKTRLKCVGWKDVNWVSLSLSLSLCLSAYRKN